MSKFLATLKAFAMSVVAWFNRWPKDHILHYTLADSMSICSLILGCLIFGWWLPGVWAALLFSFILCSATFFGKEILIDHKLDWNDIKADYIGYAQGLVKAVLVAAVASFIL